MDYVLDTLVGYKLSEGSRQERLQAARSYDHSAQVATILGRGAYSNMIRHQLHNFCLLHERYVHPRHVLAHDHITLHGITPTHVFFCVLPPGSKSVYDTTANPFVWVKQFFGAEELVIMSHESFHRLAAEAGDPTADRRLTFLRYSSI